MFAAALLYLSLFLTSLVHAFPFDKRDVWAPQITSPNANSVWPVGTKQTVTWDTSNKPAQVTNPIGRVVLGHVENNSLNLQLNNPLAQGFNLTDGKVQITVPDVPPREDYIVVLIGNSGNMSPTFAITSITGGSSSSSGSGSASSSASSSVSGSAAVTVTSSATPETTSAAATLTNPIPITGTTITGGVSTTESAPPSTVTSPAASSATPSSPSSSSISSLISSALSSAAAAPSSSASSSGTAEGAQSSTTSGALSLFQSQGALLGMVPLVLVLAL